MTGIIVRASREDDIEAIRRIYAREVSEGLGTFEQDPPSAAEMARRRQGVLAGGYPHLVAEHRGRVAGYAHAGRHRPRPAYDHTVETSVYVDAGCRGEGVGRALLAALILACEHGPWRQMVAVIGDSGNAGSRALHGSLGFREVGTLRSVGFKLGRWVDTVIMQRPLGPGDGTPPGR